MESRQRRPMTRMTRAVGLTVAVAVLACQSSFAEKGPEQDFADEAAYKVEPFFGGADVKATRGEKAGPTGGAPLFLQFRSTRENSGATVSWAFPARALDRERFTLRLKTPGGAVPYVRCAFLNAQGKLICRNNYFAVAAPDWKAIGFAVGPGSGANSFEPKEIAPGQEVAKIVLQFCGRADKQHEVLLADFRKAEAAAPKAAEPPKEKRPPRPRKLAARPPAKPDTKPTIASGDTALWLDATRGHAFAGASVAGPWLPPSPKGIYPRFTCVDGGGKAVEFGADDPAVKALAQVEGEDRMAVTYSRDGSSFKVAWLATKEALRCEVSVVSEGKLRLASVGVPRVFGVALGTGDYGITPGGKLYRPQEGNPEMEFKRRGNADNTVPNFSAARVGGRILFYRPQTSSQFMHLGVERAEDGPYAWLGGLLYFRPPDVRNPATKLCHPTLSWQIETAGDANGDGEVDWVDCAVAFRDRYIKPNKDKDALLRDSYTFYHGIPGDTYERLTGVIEKLDFATGIWWVKGAMKTNQSPGSEAHPYVVEPDPGRGDKAAFAARIAATGSRVGIYYGHDYIDTTNGDWPPELIKLDADGHPHRYYKFRDRQLYYKDNVRGLASGLLKRHYEKILNVCRMAPGDPIMLDTFTAFARPGYHPDFPATPQLETEAKHEIARWLKHDKKLSVAGEGINEGAQDVVDFGAILTGLDDLVKAEVWQDDSWVPLTSVIYHGRTYFGVSWYEFRRPDPNWALALVNSAHLWQWSTGHYPEGMYEVTARTFFHQSIAWSRNADAAIVDVDREGTAYKIRYDNGNTLWADPEKNTWKLEEKGILYDGFTPFNNKGVMAILKQGDFDITLPVTEMLEVIPSQPQRDKLDVKIERTEAGKVRVRGNSSKVPWKLRWLHKNDAGAEVVDLRDVEPVLMLRRSGGGR